MKRVAAFVVALPYPRLDDHGQKSGMQNRGQRVCFQLFREDRVDLNDAKLASAHVLIRMIERRLFFRADTGRQRR